MKTKLIILTTFVLFAVVSTYAQGNRTAPFNTEDLPTTFPQDDSVRDSLIQWQERVVLQLDRKVAAPREVLFFKAYVLTGPEQLRVSASGVLKIELLDGAGQLIKTQNHQLQMGASHGSIQLPRGMKKGRYFLRAYTQWMLNYGTERLALEEVRIGNSKARRHGEIRFYPEGGDLVADLYNRLVITAEDISSSKFQIVDAQNQVVSNVKRYGSDTYSVLFTPKRGNRYFLKSMDGETYPLPLIKDIGCTLQANTIDEDYIDLRIQKSPELRGEKLFVRGQSQGRTHWQVEMDFKEGLESNVQVPKAGLPGGILLISVIDDRNHIWAERPVHLHKRDMEIEVDPLTDATTGKVTSFAIKVKSREGEPLPVELAVGIGATQVDLSENDVGSHTGKGARQRHYMEDLLVLTDRVPGYSVSVPETDFPEHISYDFQEGLEFYGQAYDLNGKLVTDHILQVLITTEDDVIAREVRTDSNGMFKLTGLQLQGEATLVTRKVAEDSKLKLVRVRPYIQEVPPLKKSDRTGDMNPPRGEEVKSAMPKAITHVPNSFSKEEGTIVLDGITLVEERTDRVSTPSVYGIEPTRKVVQDPKMPRTIPQLFLGIPGFNVTNLGGLNPNLVIPRSMGIGPILWVIDGFPLPQSSAKPSGQRTNPLREIMDLVTYVDIDRIEVLTGADAALYGSRASGGVILIYTRSGNMNDYYARKDGELTFSGYHESLDFDTYRNAPTNRRRNQSPTWYWNPSLRTDEKGEAVIQVDLPEQPGKIRFEATAMTPDGKKGRFRYTF